MMRRPMNELPVYRPVRHVSSAALIATLAVVFGGHVLFWTVEPVSSALDSVATWSGQLIQPTLTINAIELVLLVALWFGAFGLRQSDLGIFGERLRGGLCVLVAGWLGIQLVRVVAALVTGQGLVAGHTRWVIGAALAQLLGNALVEEIVHRGLIFPQLYQRIRARSDRERVLRAVVLGSGIFAVNHVLMLINRGYAAHEVAAGLFVLALTGCFFAAIYVRTKNLFVVIVVHALTNVSGDIVASPIDGRVLAFALGAGCIVWWPRERNTPTATSVLIRR